jgi:hypothetical protein
MIWHNERLIFIHIPKCGGTSVRRCMQHKLGGKHKNRTWIHGWKTFVEPNLWNQHAYYDQYALVYRDYTYCTQVRNPYTRFESMWKHCLRADLTTKDFYEWGNRTIDNLAVGDWEFACDNDRRELMIEYYYSKREILSMLFQPQWRWVRSPVKVFKLEDMTIWDYIKLPPIHENNSQKDKRVASREIVWSQELREKVYEVYREDFRKFRY